MNSLFNKFLHRVRIHGGEFDASARAMHRNAAVEIVSSATIERKKMSTKTTLKRIALVAVAVTGFGLVSAVPSFAASQADTLSFVSTTSTGVIGTSVSAVFAQSFIATNTADELTTTASLVSAPAGSVVLPTLAIGGGTEVNADRTGTGGLVSVTNAVLAAPTYTTGYTTASFIPTHSGTYVIKFTPTVTGGSGILQATALTWTVVIAATPAVTAANSSSITNSGIVVNGLVDAAVAKPMAAVNAAGGQAATIVVTAKNSSNTDLTASTVLTATISGPGNLGFGGGAGPAVGAIVPQGRAITAGAAGYNYIGVFADGTAGVSTITISAGTTVLATETVSFYGAVVSYANVPANSLNTIPTAATTAAALNIVALDANGVVVPSKILTMTSSNTAVIASGTVSSSLTKTAADISLTTLAATGVVTLTFSDSTATIAATTTATITVSSGAITTSVPSLSFDKATYAPGEKMVLTLSAKDASGLPVPTITAASLLTAAGLVSNTALQGFPAIPLIGSTTDGSISWNVYAPLISGDVTVNGVGANTAATVLTATATVTGGAIDSAIDAANAATDAANYAADAADAATTAAQEATAAATAAQDSADAATAAVVALGLRVNTLMASVRAQITSLSNLIVRIIKKIHA